jgi:hypothetical protein
MLVDELLLKFTLDAGNLDKNSQRSLAALWKLKEGAVGHGKEIEKTAKGGEENISRLGKNIEQSAKGAGEFIGKLSTSLLGLFAVFTGGRAIKDFISADIHQIAAGLFANLLRFRVSGNPAPLARAVDGDGTSRRHAER